MSVEACGEPGGSPHSREEVGIQGKHGSLRDRAPKASGASPESSSHRELGGIGMYLFQEEAALAARDNRSFVEHLDDRPCGSLIGEGDRTRAPDDHLLISEERECAGIGTRLRAHPVIQVW